MEILVFGQKVTNLGYKTRVGVYGIILNENRDQILLIRTIRGGYFLPGGGIEETENHEECLHREMLEETGFLVVVGEYLGQAKKYHLAMGKNPTLSHAHFYFATLCEKVQEPIEMDEEPIWVTIDKAEELLFHEHQVWGVKQAINK
ncbi:NUDIX hydrolase [Robertmurraya korlensis]|uniref:NUDIX hydrolase n=1 Tax=Robertmurraya korlensis TaxID=519977 RepID=UPI000A01A615|nr:NUDIX domain-containing protein [Robertmurraya korlensis]